MSAPQKAGIIGWPVTHSRSPLIHNGWMSEYGIDGVYEHCPIDPQDDFRAALGGLAAAGFVGANVTIPHKEAAFRAMDELSPAAQKLGAVNTISFQRGLFVGANTDGDGFIASLEEAAPDNDWREKPALVLGAGGAARAVVVALAAAGVRDIRVTNRTRARAEDMVALADGRLGVAAWAARADAAEGCGLLVNTTSLGMSGAPPLDMPLDGLAPKALVSDIVYAPLQTDLLHRAAAQGFQPVDGLGMLMHQAALSFDIWFGVRPQVGKDLRARLVADLTD